MECLNQHINQLFLIPPHQIANKEIRWQQPSGRFCKRGSTEDTEGTEGDEGTDIMNF